MPDERAGGQIRLEFWGEIHGGVLPTVVKHTSTFRIRRRWSCSCDHQGCRDNRHILLRPLVRLSLQGFRRDPYISLLPRARPHRASVARRSRSLGGAAWGALARHHFQRIFEEFCMSYGLRGCVRAMLLDWISVDLDTRSLRITRLQLTKLGTPRSGSRHRRQLKSITYKV